MGPTPAHPRLGSTRGPGRGPPCAVSAGRGERVTWSLSFCSCLLSALSAGRACGPKCRQGNQGKHSAFRPSSPWRFSQGHLHFEDMDPGRCLDAPSQGVAVPVVPCVLWDFWSLWHASLGGSETDACSPGPPWDSTGTFRDPAEGLPSTSALVAQKLTMCPSSSYDPGASVHTHSPQGKWGESRSSPLRRGRGPLGRRPGQGRGSAIAPGCTELLAGL